MGRLLGGRYRERVKPYASLLMDDPGPLAEHLAQLKAEGFRAFKMGWGPFGRRGEGKDGFASDEAIVRAARETVGDDCLLMVDAGGSDAFWPNGYKWALRTAEMLADYDVTWFEEPLKHDAIDDYALLRRTARVPISGGEVLTRRQAFLPWLRAGALRHRAARRHQGGRPLRVAQDRLDGRELRRAPHPPRLEHGHRPGRRPATGLGACPIPTWSSTSRARPTWMISSTAAGTWTPTGCWRSLTCLVWALSWISMPSPSSPAEYRGSTDGGNIAHVGPA